MRPLPNETAEMMEPAPPAREGGVITAANSVFPYSNNLQDRALSRSSLILVLASPLLGWAILYASTFKNYTVDLFLGVLYVFTVIGHLLPAGMSLADPVHRNYMRQFPVRYYVVPVLLIAFTMFITNVSVTLTWILFGLFNGHHIGKQSYGIMRLIDRKLGVKSIGMREYAKEKNFLVLTGMLPASVSILAALGFWNSWSKGALLTMVILCATFLSVHTFRQYRRNLPLFRIGALWAFAPMVAPWAFYGRYDTFQFAILLAGITHAFQYLVTYRLYMSGRQQVGGARTPNIRKMKYIFAGLLGASLIIELVLLNQLETRLTRGFIWSIVIVHNYYDLFFWRNADPHFRTHVMEPLYAAVDSLKIK